MIRENKKIPKNIKARIPELVKKIAGDKDIVALYLFGSLAQNEPKPLSDLDFGILLNIRLNKERRLDKHLELIGIFNETFRTDEIDLIVMNDAPIRMAFQILKTGKMLVCKDVRSLTAFRESMVKKYLDFKCMRDAFDAVFLEGIGYHG